MPVRQIVSVRSGSGMAWLRPSIALLSSLLLIGRLAYGAYRPAIGQRRDPSPPLNARVDRRRSSDALSPGPHSPYTAAAAHPNHPPGFKPR
jgi:hypothetical protein